jgi:hypothetical protein
LAELSFKPLVLSQGFVFCCDRDVMDQIQKEVQLALEEIDEERAHDSQSMQRLDA